jgi:hypothetical protein
VIEAFDPNKVLSFRVDIRRMAAVAHSVVIRDALPERRAVFVRLADGGFYDLAILTELPEMSRGAWYAKQQQIYVSRETSSASVPEEVVSRGYELRGGMIVTLEHWMGDNPRVAARLESIREGSGRLDLATDLEGLVELYNRPEVRSVISHDFKHYRESDVDEATSIADRLFAAIGVGQESEAARWAGLSQRAGTLMMRLYEEHRRCGQFAFGKDEDVSVTYPSLVAAVRHAPSRRGSDESPPSEAGEVSGEAV